MADPFEVRMKFTASLQQMNASVTSAQKAAHYAIKYRDMDEDLHSCILEQLEKNSMNNRANVMYFIEHLCDMASRDGHPNYVRMMQRDILRIVDTVAPEDGSGAANVKVVRKVLHGLQQKNFLQPATVMEIDECLRDRDILPQHIGLSSPIMGSADSESVKDHEMSKSSKSHNSFKLDKKQIEQRIEEDRERHKRLREYQWAVIDNNDLDAEFEHMWSETSSINSDDFQNFEEEALQRAQCAQEQVDYRNRSQINPLQNEEIL